VWGGSRLTWIGGRWTDRDASNSIIRESFEMRRVPKYVPHDRWHVERWTPAETYGSPEMWYAQTTEVNQGIYIPALGPYPARGEYEHSFTLSSANGDFMPLSVNVCDWIVRAIEWARQQPAQMRRMALAEREFQRERNFDRVAEELLLRA